MNTKPFTQKNILSSIQVACKTLIILILSLLLIAPTPAWALDYNGTLQSYVSKVKVELDGVVTSIQKLPIMSYENGKTALADIDNKLEKIKNDAGKDAAYFQELSDQAQQNYQTNLDKINNLNDPGGIISALLQVANQDLSNTITLTSKISNLCDNLKRRINLTTQKFANVKEYADALNSFSDSDLLTEIVELNTLLLIAPIPELALEYNPQPFVSYLSKLQTELDGLVPSIERLVEELNYPDYMINDQAVYAFATLLAEINNKLGKLRNDVSKYAVYFQKLSDQLDQEYQKNGDNINEDAALLESNNKLSRTIELTRYTSKVFGFLERELESETRQIGYILEEYDLLKSYGITDATAFVENKDKIAAINSRLQDIKNYAAMYTAW